MIQAGSPRLSIAINNFNNGAYLREAIDSALSQDLADVEVVVVDDGSTDDSPEIIRSYGDAITAALGPNRGQGSAINIGFRLSRGDVVIFLDSDDRLEPHAAHAALDAFDAAPDAARLHWPMVVIDTAGAATGEINKPQLDEGDLRDRVLRGGPYTYEWASTSGNAWRRWFLRQVLPVDESVYFQGVDNYLAALAPLFGPVKVCAPLSCWRSHETNYSAARHPFEERLAEWLARFDLALEATERHARQLRLPFDPDVWLAGSWFHRMDRAVRVIIEHVPENSALVLLDEDQWAVDGVLHGRRCLPFLEHDGQYAGRPTDGGGAAAALEAMLDRGAQAVAIAWPAFWWLEFYPELVATLTRRLVRVAETPDVQLYLAARPP